MGGRPAAAILRIDGASRGNPGPAGCGVILEDADGGREEHLRYLGRATNNAAEYQALLLGLGRAAALGYRTVEVRSDSELLVRQMTGVYRVKHPGLQALHRAVRRVLTRFEEVRFTHVGREANAEADRLANLAIDRALVGGSRR
ncbi:MAG TPA: ribonuclease HI family protein [Candidatus Methylomirabilis sp.]|nr:ribonuclease HI family protein [Candidatus Methylomirabilis sp.]